MLERFQKAKNLINKAQNILLATHNDPDGDAFGSLLSAKLMLEGMDKKVTDYCVPPLSPLYSFLPGFAQIQTRFDNTANFDLIIGLDYGNFERLGLTDQYLDGSTPFLTFDHHLRGRHLGFLVVENYSSVSEIIFDFMKFLNFPIDREIATCLLTGIFTDTGGFRHPNTQAKTLAAAGYLLSQGAPLNKISKLANRTDLPGGLELWNQIFKYMKTDEEIGLAFALIPYENYAKLGSNLKTSISDIANFLSSAPEISFTLLMTEKEPGKIEGSLRAQPNRGIDVAKIAEIFGGGGHPLAAGFQTTIKPKEIVERINQLTANKQS